MKQTVDIQENILLANDDIATAIRERLAAAGVVSINVMASPGAGKTTVIEQTVDRFKGDTRILVIEGDVVDIDVDRLRQREVEVRLANTGGACHLDAPMVTRALEGVDMSEYDLIIVENVGNLICPANFDIGTGTNIVIASVPEGHDKPRKYPGMFAGADVVLLNKFDYAQAEGFDIDVFKDGLYRVAPETDVIAVSAKTGENMDAWYRWLETHIASHT